MGVTVYTKPETLTGGGTALDGISATALATGDEAFVEEGGVAYRYKYSATSSEAESVPDVIAPDDAGATGRWILQVAYQPLATEVQAGKVQLASSAEAAAGTDDAKAVTPKKVKDAVPAASESVAGKVQLATDAEAAAGTDDAKAVTPKKVKDAVPAASESVAGKVELASSAEAVAGTDDAKAMTPKKVKDVVAAAGGGGGGGGNNLLVNPTFDACSLGTPVGANTALAEDDCSADNTGDWTTAPSVTLDFDTDHYEIGTTGAGSAHLPATLPAGRMCIVEAEIKDGTRAGAPVVLGLGASYTSYGDYTKFITTPSWTAVQAFVRASTSDTGIIAGSFNLGGDNYEIRNISVGALEIEFAAGSNDAPDGFRKSSTAVVRREYSDSPRLNHYKCRLIPSAVDDSLYEDHSTQRHLKGLVAGGEFGRGYWVRCSKANHARVYAYDGTLYFSDYHPGDGQWHFLKVHVPEWADVSYFYFGVRAATDNGDIEVEVPVLVSGSDVSEGHYAPLRSVVDLEDSQALTSLHQVTGWSTSTNNTYDIGVETGGRVGDGVSAVRLVGQCRDSGSASTAACQAIFTGPDGKGRRTDINASGRYADAYASTCGEVAVLGSEFRVDVYASSTGTLDFNAVEVTAIEV